MKKIIEALRRLLVLLAWCPTAIYSWFVVAHLEEALSELDELLPIYGSFIVGSTVAHYIINWIFQVNDSNSKNPPQSDEDDDEVDFLTVEAYMDKQSVWLTIIGGGWLLGAIWLGQTNNGYPTPYWGMWSSFESFTSYWSSMWIYFILGFGGFILLRVFVERNYRNKLRRHGFLR